LNKNKGDGVEKLAGKRSCTAVGRRENGKEKAMARTWGIRKKRSERQKEKGKRKQNMPTGRRATERKYSPMQAPASRKGLSEQGERKKMEKERSGKKTEPVENSTTGPVNGETTQMGKKQSTKLTVRQGARENRKKRKKLW